MLFPSRGSVNLDCSNYTNRTHEPVAIQLPFNKIYIITEPHDVADVFNNQDGLDVDFSLKELLKAL